jgi:hypothetical protein
MILMVMTMLLSAMGVVREKEIGTMEQIIVMPMRKRRPVRRTSSTSSSSGSSCRSPSSASSRCAWPRR